MPKDGNDSAEWCKSVRERISRIIRDRQFRTTVRPLRVAPDGTEFKWRVTVHWNKPKKSVILEDKPGIWTLREYSPCKNGKTFKVRILSTIRATLGCDGDDLYCHLPEGDVPEGYDVFPDGREVAVCSTSENEGKYWTFTFNPSRK